MDNFPMPGWPPLGYPPVAPPLSHNCVACHNCHSCGRPPHQPHLEDSPHPSSTTPTPSLLGRLQTPSASIPARAPAVPLAQRLRDAAPLVDRMAPPPSLTQRLRSPAPQFVQGSSSRPLQERGSLAQRMGETLEEGEFSDEDDDESTSRAQRSRRGGRKEWEKDQRQAE